MQSVVDELNENGGIGGRQIELKILLVDGTAGPEVGQAACIEMTDDFGAFAVILGPAMSRDVARCTSVTKETLTMNSTGFDEALYEEADGRLFSTGSGHVDVHRSPVRGLGEAARGRRGAGRQDHRRRHR